MPFIKVKDKKVLFIHIPKTGGTSIEAWMKTLAPLKMFSVGVPNASRCTPQHYTSRDIRAILGDNFFNLAVTVVRNPYDRIASEYRMQTRLSKQGIWKNGPQFSLWLEDNLSRQTRERFHLDNHLRPQWEFLGNDVEVFRFEDGLSAPIKRIADALNVIPPKIPPHELRSENHKFTWDIADRLLVQNHYSKDFEYFGYRP